MKHAAQIFFRWLILAIVFLFVYQITKAQCPDDFKLIRRDTTVAKGIFIIDSPIGKRAKIVFEDIPSLLTTIDNAALQHVGTGWTKAANTTDNFLNKTASFSKTVGDHLIYNFLGKRVEIISSLAAHHGKIGVTIGNGGEFMVDLYSATRKDQQTVFTVDVTPGTNSIKIRVTGLKNTAATDVWGLVDAIRVTQ